MKIQTSLVALALLAAPAAAAADCQMNELLELPVVMQGLRPTVPAKVNGADARFVLDSGEYESWVTSGAAARLRMRATLEASDYRIESAGGAPMTTARTLTLGSMTFKDAAFQIDDGRAAQGVDGYIGQKLLKVADVDYDLKGGLVRLLRPAGCGDQPLAYWLKPGESFGVANLSSGGVYGTDATATARINGVDLKVGFDTGETVSVLTLAAAKRAGISPGDPGVVKADVVISDGKGVQLWTAPIKSFEFGGEEVRDTRLRISATDLFGYDLILGSDFFLSHHVYFANGQHKLYVTYAGGPVFAAYAGGGRK
jgi:predicted aspartyl protease